MKNNPLLEIPDLPATLYPSRLKVSLYTLGACAFVFGGIFLIKIGKPLVGYLNVGFFGLCAVVFISQFHPRSAYLRLEPDGFIFCSLFRAHEMVKWAQVHEFAVVRVAGNRMVAWNFRHHKNLPSKVMKLSKTLSGYEAALPDTYGLKAEDLCQIMNTIRDQRDHQLSDFEPPPEA